MSESKILSDSIVKADKNDEVSASHFALQIALQTMKERCQLLQQRLSTVEEENVRLRIIESQNKSHINCGTTPTSDISKLEEKITQLSRQKCQLIDRITMVAKENNQLWTRLSRVTEANQSLGNHLSKISDTLNKHPVGDIPKVSQSLLVTDDSESRVSKDGSKEESLEEISLKIIDTIMREKKVLEQQCEEMVELQTGAVSVEECGFTLTANGSLELNGCVSVTDENVMEDIRNLRRKMKEEYKILKDQQEGLQLAISSLNALIAEKKSCKCRAVQDDSRSKNSDTKTQEQITFNVHPAVELHRQLQEIAEPPVIDSSDLREIGSTDNLLENDKDSVNNFVDDRICPLCGKRYDPIEVEFEVFHEHVIDHFKNEDQDNNSFINNYENTS